MSGSILQSRESSASVTGTTIQLAFLSNNTAHNVLWVVAHSDNTGSATHSVADTLVNSYSAALDTLIDADNGNRLSHWSVSDSLAGANTVTITFSVTAQFRAIYISEITGVQNLANDGHNARHQLNPGTATDAVTSNAATNTATAFMIALSNDDSGADNAPAVGTGFSLDKTAWNFATPGATIEFKSGVAAGSNTATFTAITATDDPNTLMAMFKESVSGVQPILATSRSGRGPGSGPRMRRLQPQTFPTPGPVDTVTPTPSATPFHIGGGGKQVGMPQRRAIPQQYPDTIPFVQDGSATQTPFRIGRGGGIGAPTRRMFPQRYADSSAITTTLAPTEGAITFAGAAASITLTIAAVAGSIIIDGNAPSISTALQATEGAIVISGNAANTTTTFGAVAGAIVIGGSAPSVSSTLLAFEGAIVIDGNAPNIGAASLLPTEGAITIDGNAPSITIDTAAPAIRNFSLRNWRQWHRPEDERELRKLQITPAVAEIIAQVAERQAQQLEQDEHKRFEELERQLELKGLEFQGRYLDLLNIERQQLIDAEIKGFYEAKQALDEENKRRLLLLLAFLS